jgi:Flp pilus assembly CpaE family ATPase
VIRHSEFPNTFNVFNTAAFGRRVAFPKGEMQLTTGSVFAFVPADGGSKARAVARELSRALGESRECPVLMADFNSLGFPLWGTGEAPQRLDDQTFGAFVTPGETFDTLEAREAHPREVRRILKRARDLYNVTCADLTEAKEVVALEVLRQADSIFIVSDSDSASLDMAR